MKQMIRMMVSLALALMTAACAPRGGGGQWTYSGDTGPKYWYKLNPDYRIAKDGKEQSPVDITDKALAAADGAERPEFNYGYGVFEVENNGHTIELVPESNAEHYIVIDGVNYALQQIHFHAPSEHLLNGKAARMEAHLVHRDADGRLAVTGVFINEGDENSALEPFFAALPQNEEERPESELDPSDLLPGEGDLYRYAGSLTTPPCSEGVIWHIFAEPIEMSAAQIAAFTSLYKGNSRPVQPLNKRTITRL